MFRFGHLRAADFIDLVEGTPLSRAGHRHLTRCAQCQAERAAMASLYDDVASIEGTRTETFADVDWDVLRTGVRDQLLARAVKRRSLISGIPRTVNPSFAWGATVVLLISVVSLASLWNHRTARSSLGTETVVSDYDETLFLDGLEAEATAWSQTDIYSALAELEVAEEETLRQLITLALAEDDSILGQPQ